MKKVFLICLFNKETRKYLSTYNKVYATRELAEKEKEGIKNPNLIASIIKVDMILEADYIN